MPEPLKIGVVHRGQSPQLFSDFTPEATSWCFEFFHQNAILGTPFNPRRDFLAVFFCCDNESNDVYRQLGIIFPGAEIIGYHQLDSMGPDVLKKHDGLSVVQLPMNFAFAQQLMQSYARAKDSQRDLSAARRRCDELIEFFEAFINMIEASWSLTERKLGMNILINRIVDHIRAEECVIYLFNDAGATLHRAYCTGNIKDIDLFDYHANSPIVENVLNSGNPYLNNDYSFELKVPFSKDSVFIHSILCLPLQRRGEKIGVVEVLNKKDPEGFTDDDQALLQRLVNPLTVAIKTVSMFESSERLTITDDLTKLYNYRYLMQFLDAEVKRCLRYKKKVSLLFIDIDGFKRINDSFGHLVGSQALAEMGQVFRRILRETDIVGRYGGDEFVIVLPETPLNGAMVIAERIRKKVEDFEFVAQNLSIRLTVSLGVSNCPKHTLTAEGLLKKADAAMYRAKEISKNSIKVAV